MTNTEKLFETIANYTYDWESWIGQDGKLLWVNPAVERMTGYTTSDCLQMEDYPLPIVDIEDREKIAQYLASAVDGSSGNDIEFRIRDKQGQLLWAAVSWQTIYDSVGIALGFRTSVRDITQRKQVEWDLQVACEEAERANRATSRFLAAASHDLRQPLQAAGLFVGTIDLYVKDTKLSEIVASLRKCLDSANDLLEALLDLSRLDAGIIGFEPKAFAIIDLLDRVDTKFGGTAKTENISLEVVASSAFVYTDPILLTRVIDNLVSNAIRYKRGGRIIVGARYSKTTLKVEVWDNGIGIPEDQQEKIFEEFYQIGNVERDRTRGLGLGLSVVRHLTRLMGSKLEVRSWPGKGSVFSVEVPLASSDMCMTSEDNSPAFSTVLTGLKVAAVDDEPLQLAALQAFLSVYNCHVITATTTEGLAANLNDNKVIPDLIIADYRLHGEMTGVQAIQYLRKEIGEEVPAMLITGDTEPARIAEANESGYPILHKPVNPAEFLDILSKILNSI